MRLTMLVVGHGLDIGFNSGMQATAAAWRAVKHLQRSLNAWVLSGGIAARLRAFSKENRWAERGRWTWHHAGTGKDLSLNFGDRLFRESPVICNMLSGKHGDVNSGPSSKVLPAKRCPS